MPNQCYQVLKFTCHGEGSAEMIRKIKSSIWNDTESRVDFEKIIPPPANMFRGLLGKGEEEECKAAGIPNWRDWQTENWGAKWNAYDCTLSHEDDWKIGFRFSTAWGVPKPIIDRIFDLFPGVAINYAAADDGGFVAYHRTVNDKGKLEQRDFKDISGVHAALFCVLNTSY